jgi:23S rRNA (pseudouridine1915-N3)-methyltransferase
VKIVIVQRGRIRDPLVAAARDEYVKRFRRFGSLEVVERETRDDESLFPKGRGYKVRLDETGVAMTSVEFARALERWAMAHGQVTFAIGGPHGHGAATTSASDASLALSAMTLNHALAHLLLLEQVYRAATILAGDPYHHA